MKQWKGGRTNGPASPATLCKDGQRRAVPSLTEERALGEAWRRGLAASPGCWAHPGGAERALSVSIAGLPLQRRRFAKLSTSHALPLRHPYALLRSILCPHKIYFSVLLVFIPGMECKWHAIHSADSPGHTSQVKGPWLSGSPSPSRAAPTGTPAGLGAALCPPPPPGDAAVKASPRTFLPPVSTPCPRHWAAEADPRPAVSESSIAAALITKLTKCGTCAADHSRD